MSFFLNDAQEKAFRLMTDYVFGRRMKILESRQPSYIKAEFGSWTSMSLANSKGDLEVDIMEREGKSYINLNFGFWKSYLMDFVISVLVILIVIVVVTELMFAGTPAPLSLRYAGWLSPPYLLDVIVILPCLSVIMGLAAVGAYLTKKRMTEEFNMFIQSLAQKE